MSKAQNQFREDQKKEIREALYKSKNVWEQKRLTILNMRAQLGSTTEEIARAVSCSNSAVSHAISNYFKHGIVALLWQKKQGNHRNLSKTEEETLLKPFLEEASKGKMLIVTDIHRAYEKKFNAQVPLSTVYRILKRHGWRKIMPHSKHPKSKPEEFEGYKKNERENIDC